MGCERSIQVNTLFLQLYFKTYELLQVLFNQRHTDHIEYYVLAMTFLWYDTNNDVHQMLLK